MAQKVNKVNESTELTIPIKNLLTIIAVVAVAVWTYNTQVVKRIDKIEMQQNDMAKDKLKMDEWHAAHPASNSIEDNIARVRELEIQLAQLTIQCLIKKQELEEFNALRDQSKINAMTLTPQ